MKAARDTQRRLATIPSPKEMHLPQGAAAEAQTRWHATMLDVVYMIFLGYEAGRKAIHHLVEFEPAAAENTIVILITELTCYGLLLGNLKDDPLLSAPEVAPGELQEDHGEALSQDRFTPRRSLLAPRAGTPAAVDGTI